MKCDTCDKEIEGTLYFLLNVNNNTFSKVMVCKSCHLKIKVKNNERRAA